MVERQMNMEELIPFLYMSVVNFILWVKCMRI